MRPDHFPENPKFVDRRFELERIAQMLGRPDPSIMVVYGRRRVGKTELLEQGLRHSRVIKFEGLEGQPASMQRQAFLDKLATATGDLSIAKLHLKTWRECFELLARFVEGGNWVIYLEELQWLAGGRHRLISDLKYVWDNFFRRSKGVHLVLCGSSNSFMVKKVVRSRALYSRSMFELPVMPFSLAEARQFLPSGYSARGVLDAYLSVGGIPEYLRYLGLRESPQAGLAAESFVPGGYFVSEFEKVFVSTLGSKRRYRDVIVHLSHAGPASRQQIAGALSIADGGTLTGLLQDLELAGFIQSHHPYNLAETSKRKRYTIADNYLRYYQAFIAERRGDIRAGQYRDDPLGALDRYRYQQFLAFGFERFCRENQRLLAKILGISGVRYKHGPYFRVGSAASKGFQCDLVFQRADRCLTVFEIKYAEAPLPVAVAEAFEEKLTRLPVPKSHSLHRVLVSAGPVSAGLRESRTFDRVIELEELLAAEGL